MEHVSFCRRVDERTHSTYIVVATPVSAPATTTTTIHTYVRNRRMAERTKVLYKFRHRQQRRQQRKQTGPITFTDNVEREREDSGYNLLLLLL